MANLGIYLAYENAKEAMEYYEKYFNAKIIERSPVTKEMNEHYKLEESKLKDSTAIGRFEIDGVVIGCSDRVDNNKEFNDSFNIMIEYNGEEEKVFMDMVNRLNSCPGEIIFNSSNEIDSPYKMFRFKDKFNIIFSFIII